MLEPELAVLIDEAASIAASGRWETLNDVIRHLAANPGADNTWLVQLLGALCAAVLSEYLQLKRSYARDQKEESATLAWRARNLLELSVWCEYCSKSR